MVNRKTRNYHYSMPLQPLPHGLLCAILESVHVIGQKEAVHQTLGNTTSLTFVPDLYTSDHKKRLAIQLECRLPLRNDLGGRCHIRPGLGHWFLDDDASWWLRRTLGWCITQADGGLLDSSLPFPGSVGRRRRRRGSLTTALRWLLLRGWMGTEHKAINCHCPLCHHVFTLVGFDFRGANRFDNYFLSFLNGNFEFGRGHGFNRGLRLRGALGWTDSCACSRQCWDTCSVVIPYRGKFEISKTCKNTFERINPQITT